MTQEYDCILFTDIPDRVLTRKLLGAYKIAMILRAAGYKCLVIDHFHAITLESMTSILDKVVSERTKMIGFSIGFFANLKLDEDQNIVNVSPLQLNKSFCPQGQQFELAMYDKIKTLNPNCKIVIGGPQTLSDQVNNPRIDYIVVGYAESTVLDVIQHIYRGKNLENSYKNIFGVIVVDDRANAKYKFSSCTMSWLPQDIVNSRVLPIELSRGCIFDCAFCHYPMRSSKINEHLRTVDSIVNELQFNYDHYRIDTYWIVDSTFNDNQDKIDHVLSAVRRLTFQPKFWCYARIDLASTPERVAKLYDIGVKSMFLGIETMNRATGRLIGKSMPADRQIDLIESIRKNYNHEIQLHGSFIIGLPNEPLSSIQNTANLVIDGSIPLHTARFNALKIHTGQSHWNSNLDLNYKKFGYTEQNLDALGMEDRSKLGYLVGADFFPWKNQHLNFNEATNLQHKINQDIWDSKSQHIQGEAMWALLNYEQLTFDSLKTAKVHEFDWTSMEKLRSAAIKTYFQKLHDHLVQ